jgi:hypothetical protein
MNRQKKYCLRCSAINPEEAEVCAQCGKSFYEASLQAPPEIQPKVELLPVLPLPQVVPEWKKAYIEPPSTCSSSQAIDQTKDGGYVIAGETDSLDSGHQAYLVKTDANGNVGPLYPSTWQKILGGKGYEDLHDIRQTSDEGYIMTGRTSSFDPSGKEQLWLVKTDADGNFGPDYPDTWEKTYSYGMGASVRETSDGQRNTGYIVAGINHTSEDWNIMQWYILKTDLNGNVGPAYPNTWEKTYAASYDSLPARHCWCYCIQQTSDLGYIATGDFRLNWGGSYAHLLKLSASGEIEWSKNAEVSGYIMSEGSFVQQTSDLGYFIAGSATASFDSTTHAWTPRQLCLIKTDANGNFGPDYPNTWAATFGSGEEYAAWSGTETKDHGFIAAGYTVLGGTDHTDQFYVVKVDASGSYQWDGVYGGLGQGFAMDVKQTSDLGYIVAGTTAGTSSKPAPSRMYVLKFPAV